MLKSKEKFTKELIKRIASKGYSRIPVFESGEKIKIIGNKITIIFFNIKVFHGNRLLED